MTTGKCICGNIKSWEHRQLCDDCEHELQVEHQIDDMISKGERDAAELEAGYDEMRSAQ